jgi:hypothetical protein
MEFSINVALERRHYCTVTRRGGPHTRLEVLHLLEDLQQRFPAKEGYSLTLNEVVTQGHSYTPAQFIQDCQIRGITGEVSK